MSAVMSVVQTARKVRIAAAEHTSRPRSEINRNRQSMGAWDEVKLGDDDAGKMREREGENEDGEVNVKREEEGAQVLISGWE